MREPATIYPARKIITMNRHRPFAEAIAVSEGRLLGVGPVEELKSWGEHRIDDSLRDKVLLPGFVEGHCHALEGGMWAHVYTGFYDRMDPNGKVWPGLKSIDEVVQRLQEADRAMEDPDTPLTAWGLDPVFFEGRRMVAADLDRVSTTRPIFILHANVHVLNVNSLVLEKAGITADSSVEGVMTGEDGKPNGELQEFAAMFLAQQPFNVDYFARVSQADALRDFGRMAVLTGTTTATDLYNELPESVVDNFRTVTAEADYPLCLVSAYTATADTPERGVEKMADLMRHNTDRLRFGLIKVMTDGTLQSFTARLNWPGYYGSDAQGIWNLTPQQFLDSARAFHKAGHLIHMHTNGDQASDLALDVIGQVLAEHPRLDHRHTIQHGQMLSTAQFRRIANLSMCANLFSNHIYYWGDIHYRLSLGPERAERMNAAATAAKMGVNFAIHSDAPVTPLGPLFTAWCAVNRLTSGGRILGESERITVPEALYAITMGAAYTLKMDHEIGSLEAGKRADVAILEDDPLEVSREQLKDLRIHGTMQGGRIFEAGT
ncbi:amidohydrolase [Fodinicurvata halophila]|uniref:Amidohydrolase n=1 Tax=Fodinicurvata halophila TaxID=1419723 RepID=A0ABV8UQU3_9PROT